ncbi:MAG: NUDIX hydrolase [Deltaproteobacteria bacterium]|nr:NUDIX hydrolase [Deltaproteobacteria bacterium]MBW2383724.1 NUDIX hydrolase [Deltaproteobacteria bacterium]MBW2698497.1 NUDIX hydrolase [Deltaproteobacteria bacterium]
MHRRPLLRLLERYAAAHPEERSCVGRIRGLVESDPDCFLRRCGPGHITASAWILSPDRRRFLLTHHRKLGRWLQLGGHADGDADVLNVALREAREESGMTRFALVSPAWAGGGEVPMPIDVDVHWIPARPGEPAHEHHDIRFLLVAGPDQLLRVSYESHDLAWLEVERLADLEADESLLRLARKAHRWVGKSSIPTGEVAGRLQGNDGA